MVEWLVLITQLVQTNLIIDKKAPLFWFHNEISSVFQREDGWNKCRLQTANSAATFLTKAEATADTKDRALALRALITTKIQTVNPSVPTVSVIPTLSDTALQGENEGQKDVKVSTVEDIKFFTVEDNRKTVNPLVSTVSVKSTLSDTAPQGENEGQAMAVEDVKVSTVEEVRAFTVEENNVPTECKEIFEAFILKVKAQLYNNKDPKNVFSNSDIQGPPKYLLLTNETNTSGIVWGIFKKVAYLTFFLSFEPGKGLGTVLLRHFEDVCSKKKCEAIIVFVNSSVSPKNIYSKFGYTPLAWPALLGFCPDGKRVMEKLNGSSLLSHFGKISLKTILHKLIFPTNLRPNELHGFLTPENALKITKLDRRLEIGTLTLTLTLTLTPNPKPNPNPNS